MRSPALLPIALLISCTNDPCKQEAPAVAAEVRISDPALRAQAQSMEVQLSVGELRFAKTFELAGAIDDGAATFSVVLVPQPTGPFEIEMSVVAYGQSGARGEIVAGGRASRDGTIDACNRISVDLVEEEDILSKDAGQDAGQDAGEDAGPDDIGPNDAGGSFLIVSPSAVDLPWVDRSDVLELTAEVTNSEGRTLEDLTVTTTVAWAVASLSPASGASPRTLTISIETGLLPLGSNAASAWVSSADVSTSSASFSFRFRTFQTIAVGPAADTCDTTCNFIGETGLVDAQPSITPYTHVILFGPATYSTGAGIALPARSWISGAPNAAPEDAQLRCRNGEGLRLEEDGIRVERLMIITEGECDQVINTWSGGVPEDGTGGHQIDRVVLAALRPERFGANSVERVLGLSEDTSFTNSHVYGYWEEVGSLEFAHRTRLVGNTFVFYQRSDPMLLNGTADLTIANNVFISVAATTFELLDGDQNTTNLVFSGNVVEGYAALQSGFDPAAHVFADNDFGVAEVDTPRDPRFFADAVDSTGATVPGIGTSIDGVDVDGLTGLLPGAFQNRSPRSGPRRMSTRLGPSGCNTCDVTADEANEVQVAAWSSWPGGVIEIEPGTYAGNAVISWETSLVGTGAPSDVLLESGEEDPLLIRSDTWVHDSVITMIDENRGSFLLENVTISVDASALADDTAVLIESNPVAPPGGPLQIRNTIIEAPFNSAAGLYYAMLIGDEVLVQDVVVHGPFEACARLAWGLPNSAAAPAVGADIVNMTCRLTSTNAHLPRAAFEVASTDGSRFINIAVETATIAPLFGAQRRSSGDTGAVADDPPIFFEAHAVSWRTGGGLFGGFDAFSGNYDLFGVDVVLPGAPFFVGNNDDHLAPGAAAIDSGIDPATVDASFSAGVSIDGEDRTGRAIDRGAHEQGQ